MNLFIFVFVSLYALVTLMYSQKQYIEPFAEKVYEKLLPDNPSLFQLVSYRTMYVLMSLSLSFAWFIMMVTVNWTIIVYILIIPALIGFYLVATWIRQIVIDLTKKGKIS